MYQKNLLINSKLIPCNSYMALNQSIIFKENTQSNVPRKPTFEQYIVYGIPFRCSQDNTSILTYISVYTFIYKQECNVLRECFKLD